MFHKLSTMFSRVLGTPATASGRKTRPRGFAPQVEALGQRLVPATITNGNLYIFGTNAADAVTVTYDTGTIRVVENGVSQYFARSSITGGQIWFMGYGGSDVYDASGTTGIRNVVYGGDGDDFIIGGEGHDGLFGENGNDSLYGGLGND